MKWRLMMYRQMNKTENNGKNIVKNKNRMQLGNEIGLKKKEVSFICFW